MRTPRLRAALLLACLLTAGPALAIDYRSVAETTVLHDKPSPEASKRFIVLEGTPVEVVIERESWARVRTPAGDLAWIDRNVLSDTRTVMVTANSTLLRQAPEQDASAVVEVTRDVVLETVAPAQGGWLKVRHRDGHEGYVRRTDVWGQ